MLNCKLRRRIQIAAATLDLFESIYRRNFGRAIICISDIRYGRYTIKSEDEIRKDKISRIKIGLEMLRKRNKKKSKTPFTPPRYDDEYHNGMEWLDSLE